MQVHEESEQVVSREAAIAAKTANAANDVGSSKASTERRRQAEKLVNTKNWTGRLFTDPEQGFETKCNERVRLSELTNLRSEVLVLLVWT